MLALKQSLIPVSADHIRDRFHPWLNSAQMASPGSWHWLEKELRESWQVMRRTQRENTVTVADIVFLTYSAVFSPFFPPLCYAWCLIRGISQPIVLCNRDKPLLFDAGLSAIIFHCRRFYQHVKMRGGEHICIRSSDPGTREQKR